MVPFAGRIREGRISFRGQSHSLPSNDSSPRNHALHGTAYNTEWTVASHSATHVEMTYTLQSPWPWKGHVHHRIELAESSMTCTLTVEANEDMPISIGWHPWFRKPQQSTLLFASMLERGHDYLPTGKLLPPELHFADDCFIDPLAPISLEYDDITVVLSSDCSHWVVYNQPEHATCVEPQSGPPNELNDAPHILYAGQTMQRFFTISW